VNSFWRIEHQTFADDFLTCQLKNVVLKRVVLNLEKNLKYVFSNPALEVRTGSSASTSYSSQRPPSTASLALNEMVHKIGPTSTDLPHVPIRFFLWRSVIFVKPFRTICSVQASPFSPLLIFSLEWSLLLTLLFSASLHCLYFYRQYHLQFSNLSIFKRHLKTHLFQAAFNINLVNPSYAPWFIFDFGAV